MIKDKPSYLSWPEDDPSVVKAMLNDRQSEHWKKCREFVKRLVHERAKNIPQDTWEDIVQAVMERIYRGLPTLLNDRLLKSWLSSIVKNYIIDYQRKSIRDMQYISPRTSIQYISPLVDSYDSYEDGEIYDVFSTQQSRTPEKDFMIQEELNEAVIALREYITVHKMPERNMQILHMVLFESRSFEEVATAVGCSANVVRYVVHSAQKYIREQLSR